MKIIKPSVELLTTVNGDAFLQSIERAGRTCYKSEDRITSESAPKFVKTLITQGHEAMIEHAPSISMRFICDRGVSHEIVRHRLFSFAQESTRYCNYGQDKFGEEITVIWPVFLGVLDNPSITSGHIMTRNWVAAMQAAEKSYFDMLRVGASPQEARSVLPNSLKTEIIVTGNVREWRHFFKLRCAKTAHPQMQEVAHMALAILREHVTVLFDDVL